MFSVLPVRGDRGAPVDARGRGRALLWLPVVGAVLGGARGAAGAGGVARARGRGAAARVRPDRGGAGPADPRSASGRAGRPGRRARLAATGRRARSRSWPARISARSGWPRSWLRCCCRSAALELDPGRRLAPVRRRGGRGGGGGRPGRRDLGGRARGAGGASGRVRGAGGRFGQPAAPRWRSPSAVAGRRARLRLVGRPALARAHPARRQRAGRARPVVGWCAGTR